ncbi:hypothetical protein [Sphingobacterium hungaricum]|uniref:Tetratricopeptide repeat protein n=1 Tax=Sphingobacterium hungaricum TaxID=2082723 RepID=A0A928UV71_9SPHI|nr:hypothetical protein [Sphingobacterium hungaricum]MBE8713941.1 hypothetical protein [Sphingobacterium hungaricum]
MSNFNQDFLKASFRQALANPAEVDHDAFLHLLQKYAYSQPLQLSYQRKQFLEGNAEGMSKTLLYSSSVAWLKEFVESEVKHTPKAKEEPIAETIVEQEEEVIEILETPAEIEEAEDFSSENQDREDEALEKFIQEGIGSSNYFELTDHKENGSAEIQLAQDEKEDISLYNDELMPYSFRWWLHKTRLEHAETYQPFASPHLPKPPASKFDSGKLEAALLDQQIRENIFHLQNPEDKLSDAVKQKTVEFTQVKKSDEVIEKFIREEPQIHPPSPNALNTENKARKSSEEQYTFVTETLANIYIEQGLYPKAIEVFKKLILRFPEKKSYFAHRIQETEEKF